MTNTSQQRGRARAANKYDFAGRQAIRTLTTTGQTIHSVFDGTDRRIAEYDEATGALIREYVWLGWEPMAVIEAGQVYFVRTDHIGRPVFATDASGTQVWTAAYSPFGGMTASTGTPISARFPGQWFQAESGLYQNWMRDYDPTTGRYIQADPLGLVDGASVYGYARQNPGRFVDPLGEDCRVISRDKFGTAILICDSRLYCPSGDCVTRPSTDNLRQLWPEFDECVKQCLDSEPILDVQSWWPISKSTRAQCTILSSVTGQVFGLPRFTGGLVTPSCRRNLCEERCVSCEN